MVAGNRDPNRQSWPEQQDPTPRTHPRQLPPPLQPSPPSPYMAVLQREGGKSHGPQSPPPLPTICCSGAHLPELHAMGQVHTLDPIAWGRTDDSVELGLSGSQIPVPISQPFTILEIPKNLRCDEQDNLRLPSTPPRHPARCPPPYPWNALPYVAKGTLQMSLSEGS